MSRAEVWTISMVVIFGLLILSSYLDNGYGVQSIDGSESSQAYETCAAIGGPNVGIRTARDGGLICTTTGGFALKVQP